MLNTNKTSRSIFLPLILFFFVFLILYYTKCQLGFNIFEEQSLHRYFPFNYLQRDTNKIVADPKVGALFVDDFDPSWLSPRHWTGLWPNDEDIVDKEYRNDGTAGSKCLVIINGSKKHWAYSNSQMIAVSEGDRFSLKAVVRVGGDDQAIGVGVTAYGQDKEAINWNDGYKSITGVRLWSELESEYVVPAGVKFIRFRLSGKGEGVSWVDDVGFYKRGK